MNFLGLNSPEIFIISLIILIILGPKRIEKGWVLFQRLLKFLLSNNNNFSQDKSNGISQIDLNVENPEIIEVKEEVKESKAEMPEIIEVKEEIKESKSIKKTRPKKIKK
ncbi:MAG: hypothetical protein CMD12_06220 [Flavobacteriales bacterium]|nr:hypothetical protein [Flavobacteriales bacterium]